MATVFDSALARPSDNATYPTATEAPQAIALSLTIIPVALAILPCHQPCCPQRLGGSSYPAQSIMVVSYNPYWIRVASWCGNISRFTLGQTRRGKGYPTELTAPASFMPSIPKSSYHQSLVSAVV